jgi:hypothetical protein
LNDQGEHVLDVPSGITPVESTEYARRAYKFLAELNTPEGKKLSEVQLTFDKDIRGKTLGRRGGPDAKYDDNERIVEFKMDEAYYKMSDKELKKTSPELYWAREQTFRLDVLATQEIGKGKRNLLEKARKQAKPWRQRFYEYAFEDRLPKTLAKALIGTAVFGGFHYAYSAKDEREAKARWKEVREQLSQLVVEMEASGRDLAQAKTLESLKETLQRVMGASQEISPILEYVRVMDDRVGEEVEKTAEKAVDEFEKSLTRLNQATRAVSAAREQSLSNLQELETSYREELRLYHRSLIDFSLYASLLDDAYLDSMESVIPSRWASNPENVQLVRQALSESLAQQLDVIRSSLEAADQRMTKHWIWPGK